MTLSYHALGQSSTHQSKRKLYTPYPLTGGERRTHLDLCLPPHRPQEIDEAARRRFVKRLYIPLPESAARQHIIRHLMSQQKHMLTDQQVIKPSAQTDPNSSPHRQAGNKVMCSLTNHKEFVFTGEALRTDSSYLLHCPQLWKVVPLVA